MKIIDVHSHIDYITHDIQPCVVGTCCCAVNESQWSVLDSMVKQDQNIYGAFGVHPWFIKDIKDDFDSRLKALLKTNRSYMVGEIGIDKFKPNLEKQIMFFVQQLNVAVDLQRTIVLHCVGAWDKIFQILKEYKKSELPMIIVHGFNESRQIMQNLLDNYDVVFSLGKNALYGKNCRIEQIPDNKIVVETDGKTDISLIDLINQIAEIKHNPNIAQIIYDNTLRVLKNG